ncbi:MAG TPA: PEP/pyruvate-binding domain-containing protein, partial [Stellaceae bacterium]|nr:PEP/pyruvate-binding domain-containing protein [Stellaceae bacterium]
MRASGSRGGGSAAAEEAGNCDPEIAATTCRSRHDPDGLQSAEHGASPVRRAAILAEANRTDLDADQPQPTCDGLLPWRRCGRRFCKGPADMAAATAPVIWLERLGRADVALVGGKNASLGEMVQRLGQRGVRVPAGFATTAQAYWRFVELNGLREPIAASLADLKAGKAPLAEVGAAIRRAFLRAAWPPELAEAITASYRELCRRAGKTGADVAVRSSATAEDLPEASFAGQQESFLNIRGEAALLDACRRCYGSLFTDRAIVYREAKGFDHLKVALSVGVQNMVRSDLAGAGVMFSIDTETGFDKVVLINAAWGLGENVVQGAVDPDEYQVFKPLLSDPSVTPIIGKALGEKAQKMIYAGDGERPTRNVPTSKAERAAFVLSDADILTLARWACVIEEHYRCPMDMEWARDGESGELFMLQARPETVQSRRRAAAFRSYRIKSKG